MFEQDSKLEYISGSVERIVYHDEKTSFTVLKLRVKNRQDLISVTGVIPMVIPGENMKFQGYWKNTTQYGLGFKAKFIQSTPPTTTEDIEKYLSSGLVKGIGPHFAKKLVQKFDIKVFDVIELNPSKLKEIIGIGEKRIDTIVKNWLNHKNFRDTILFLHSNGLGVTRATKIYQKYGSQTIAIISNNPYILIRDIKGIGFTLADGIAKKLGIEKNSILRARAGINFILMKAFSSDGHIALPINFLLENAEKILLINRDVLNQALDIELKERFLVQDLIDGKDFIFFDQYYNYEKDIANRLIRLKRGSIPWNTIHTEKAIRWIENKQCIKLAVNQKKAIDKALTNKLLVITGGPGTGKTTILNCIIKILLAKKMKIKLCAPTGRAAKKISESTKREAYTIHRLLQFEPHTREFKYNEKNQLDCNLLIVDESSMVDISLMYSLLKSLSSKTALLIVGDVDQLPSVGGGQVLKDIIDSQKIEVVKLTEIYRQLKNSDIVVNAHLINQGLLPIFKEKVKQKDFYFIEINKTEDIIKMVKILVKKRIPEKFKLDPIRSVQILCPMQKSGCGAKNFNLEIQKILNPNYLHGLESFGQKYALGDKVMQIENNYNKEVYNGDVGYISQIDYEEHKVKIIFYDKEVVYLFTELDEITLAYAITIHKSQGSEYDAVIIPVSMQNYLMLRKSLLYTAVTRGKKLVILVGQKKALSFAILNKKKTDRFTKLKEWIVCNGEITAYKSV